MKKPHVPQSLRQFLIILMFVTYGAMANAGELNTGIFDPGTEPFGKSYGEWSAAWWQWAVAIPMANSPVTDATGDREQVSQPGGDVWFAGGSFGGHADRSISVPVGTGILFPVTNAICWGPEDGGNTQELAACAASFFGGNLSLFAMVDGVPLKSLSNYRVTSPNFAFENGEIFGLEGGRDMAVSDGFWVMVEPLAVGAHTIDIAGALHDFNFAYSLHYDVEVVPEPSTCFIACLGLAGLIVCRRRYSGYEHQWSRYLPTVKIPETTAVA